MSLLNSVRFEISPLAFAAVIFDLDGVVTKTARVHAAAWKRLFDEYLLERAERTGAEFREFDLVTDYRQYVDGKPRYDGVRSFLESRGIALAEGAPGDGPETESICGLGNRKNRFFQAHLAEHGVEVFESTVALIRVLRRRGVRTAIVSSSRNCVPVLEAAGLLSLFDARIDGMDSVRMGLQGKPAPDIFLAAARQLDVEPACTVVVEDAISGVEAGHRGRFGAVIGIDRAGQAEALRAAGATVVVPDMAEVGITAEEPAPRDSRELPPAFDYVEEINALASVKRLAVFLDYDGTLTPIVARPENAVISDETRQSVRALAQRCTVAVVSGRGLADVRALVGIESIFYAGSHGFEIAGPSGQLPGYELGAEALPSLASAERELQAAIAAIPGAQVERKKYSVAVHYRNVPPGKEAAVQRAAEQALARHKGLRINAGKKVWDLQPDIEWHKGKALLWLLDALKLNSCATLPLYIGDDTTDEDAFRVVRGRGVAIVVREEPRQTLAQYALDDTAAVRRFLDALLPPSQEDRP